MAAARLHHLPKTEAERKKLADLVLLEQFLPASKIEADRFKKDAAAFKSAAKRKFEERLRFEKTESVSTTTPSSSWFTFIVETITVYFCFFCNNRYNKYIPMAAIAA